MRELPSIHKVPVFKFHSRDAASHHSFEQNPFRERWGDKCAVNGIQIFRDLDPPFSWRDILRPFCWSPYWLDVFSISSSGSISLTNIRGSSSSSSPSIVTILPFSSIDNLLNHRFCGDIRTGPATYGSFLVRDVWGDLGTSAIPPIYGARLYVMSLVVDIDLSRDSYISFGNSRNHGLPFTISSFILCLFI